MDALLSVSMETQTQKNQIIQESLQPQRIAKDEKAYQSVLNIEERLTKGDATNIALTGPYGSGKSSILLSLKEDYFHNYLNISLATLRPLDNKEKLLQQDSEDQYDIRSHNADSETTRENLDRLIEYSILQQLIYREKQETLPNSRLKRIFHLPSSKVKEISSSIIVAVISLIVLFEPTWIRVDWLCNLLGYKWLNIIGDGLSICYLLFFLFKTLRMLVPVLSNSSLNKLNIKSGEIEVVKNTSIFNKHLDEILYFFEMTEYDVVIIEDLDRFESTDIFVKLRELNLLLNESRVIERKIFFIYAVRDDMFCDAERVKCFDYITTVIPIINRSNAKNQLKAELAKRGVTEISGKALKELGFFLHDMRLLKNISNEYVQYRSKLERRINCEKLLAMIIYKNYFPRDFAALHDCKGVVYQLLNLKDIFVSVRVADLEKENDDRRKLHLHHQKEKHLRETELRRVYLESYREQVIKTIESIQIEGKFYTFQEIASDENLFDRLSSNVDVTYKYTEVNGYYAGRTQTTSTRIKFSDIEKNVCPDQTFEERMRALQFSLSSIEDDLIEIRKDDIRSQSLSHVMKSIDYQLNPKYEDLKVPKLIEYLVVEGYIDEDYYDYISYFYDNFIDSHDWEFILDIKLSKAHPYDYHINNPEACISEIPNICFRKVAILNVDIVDYLAGKRSDKISVARLNVILRTIIEMKKYDFLIEYFKKGRALDNVFNRLFSQYDRLWCDFVQHKDNENILKLIWYKYAEIHHSCDESRQWLSVNYNFITSTLNDIDTSQWGSLMKKYSYMFDELNDSSAELLKIVLDESIYMLNEHNLKILVSCLLNSKFESVSYKLVLSTNHPNLIKRVRSSLEECMISTFVLPECAMENESSILEILNSDNVSAEIKIEYLKKQLNKIRLNQIGNNESKTIAIQSDIVVPSWEDIIHYMNYVSDKKLTKELVKFICRHVEELVTCVIPTDSKDDERMLLSQFVATDTLPYDAYCKLLNKFTRWYYSQGVPKIEERRVKDLIAKGMVRFSSQNTNSLESYSCKVLVFYFVKNKRDFMKSLDNVTFTTEVALELLRSDLKESELTSIVPYFKEDIINEELANKILLLYLKIEIQLEYDILLALMKHSTLYEEKISLVNYLLINEVLDEERTTRFLSLLPPPFAAIAIKGKKPVIPKTEKTIALVMQLDEQGYISSYTEIDKGIRINTKLK